MNGAVRGATYGATHGAPRRTVLGIETSCDDTAAAVVTDGGHVASSVVASQVDLHAEYGGVVPELAGRAHLALLTPVLARALADAGLGVGPEGRAPDAVAATVGPGLIGSLLVGVSEAKALALAWDVPFVGVNHLEGHLFAALLDHPGLEWPLAVLLVSGGHTMLVSMEGPGRYRLLGATLDDAAGEAFDKVARFLGLGYPGGPAIEAAARAGDPSAFGFPRALLDEGLDLSFSGLKTAVVRAVRARPEAANEDVAASFQQAVIDVLVAKLVRAAVGSGARGICLAGGVAANGPLRAGVEQAGEELGIPAYLPSRAMCTDNAAMVAAAGWWQLDAVGATPLDAGADPNLRLALLA
jgi:tRNA N6-adenosine threonylcarbamoyltransferase